MNYGVFVADLEEQAAFRAWSRGIPGLATSAGKPPYGVFSLGYNLQVPRIATGSIHAQMIYHLSVWNRPERGLVGNTMRKTGTTLDMDFSVSSYLSIRVYPAWLNATAHSAHQ